MALAVACGRPAPPVPAPSPSPTTPSTTASETAPTPSATSAQRSPLPAGFVDLAEVDPTILTDLRYATAHNFTGRPVAGYRQPLCLLTRPAATALRRVQAAALAAGRSLKVYDCYRPRPADNDFVDWAKRTDQQQTKAEFYPRVPKSQLLTQGYIASPSDHSRGSTVDLTLVAVPAASQRPYRPGERLAPCTAPAGQRFPDNSIDMGTGFDCFDVLAHTDSTAVPTAARENRRLLNRLMTDAGFVNYSREWWHYRLVREPYPDTSFSFPVAR